MVFLPAMLCDEESYRPQIEGLRDLVKPVASDHFLTAGRVVLYPPRQKNDSAGFSCVPICSTKPVFGQLTRRETARQ